MKARRCVLPGTCVCQLEDFDLPDAPPVGGYLMEIHASLISPGTELGSYRRTGGGSSPYPVGYTAVGRIVAADDAADQSLEGKDVFLFPEDDRQSECHASHRTVGLGALMVPLPDGLSAQDAVFARMVNIAMTPFRHYGGKSLDAVLVVGLGLVGQVIAQVARIKGCRAIGIDPDASRRARAEASGVDVVLDPTDGNPSERVRTMTGGRGAQLTINATGRTATFPMSLQATADGGEVSTLGGARDQDETRAYDLLRHVHTRHVTLRGGWEMLVPRRGAPGSAGSSTEENLHLALRWLGEGKINLDHIRTHVIKPEGMQDAYAALDTMDPEYLGVVVDWT